MTSERYYIQDTRCYVGNCVLWWTPNGGGYTTEIDKAGLFSAEAAAAIANNRSTDIPWPEAIVRKAVVQHVRIEMLRSAMAMTSEVER